MIPGMLICAWPMGARMFTKHIQQANEGCDFDFLRTDFGAPVPEPAIY
jgi:hypothetical protein